MVSLGVRQIKSSLSKFCPCSSANDSDRASNQLSSALWENERRRKITTACRSRSWISRSFPIRLGNRGFSTLGGCLAFSAALAGLALFQLMGHIHKLAETQVALDRCTGEFALDLRAASVSMEQSYFRISLERKAAQAVCATLYGCPAAESALITALTIEASIQEVIKVYWTAKQSEWKNELSNHCNLGKNLFITKFKGNDFPSFENRYPIVQPSLGRYGAEEVGVLMEPMDDIKLHIDEDKSSSHLTSEAVASRNSPMNWDVRWTE